MLAKCARPLLLVGAMLVLSQCTRSPPEFHPVTSAPAFYRIDESLAAFERGDRDATYYHLAALWLQCGSMDLAREALLIAIATELDPTNPWSGFERAADLAAAFQRHRVDPEWKAAMAEALRAWSEALGSRWGSAPPSGEALDPGTRVPVARAASPAPVLHAAVLKNAAPRQSDDCTAPRGYVSPARRITARSPAPAVVARIVEVEATRLRLVRDLAGLRARLRDMTDLSARLHDQERELERLRTLLKP